MTAFVTTSYKPTVQMVERALQVSLSLDIPYVERENKSQEILVKENHSNMFFVIGKNKEFLINDNKEFSFHPSLAKLRLRHLREGHKDTMIDAMGLIRGDSLLDCTLGLGSDAIVSSYCVGTEGKVLGLESSPVISLVVQQGLKSFLDKDKDLVLAMRQINVINDDYENYLKILPSNSFDVIYFDPMFRQPLNKSDAISAFRSLTNKTPLSLQALDEAIRVAKRRVVVKERRNSSEFEKLNCSKIYGGKYSPIAYGVIEVDK